MSEKEIFPTIHCHNELIEDHKYKDFIPNDIIFKWFNDKYSTSKHLLVLYSIAIGLKAKNILEIGFGRSTFVLSKAAYENDGKLTCCDWKDYSYLLTKKERKAVDFICGDVNSIWENDKSFDFVFMDYFGEKGNKISYLTGEIEKCIKKMKTNGIIAIHDTFFDDFEMKSAIQTFYDKKEVEFIVLPYNYGLALIRCKHISSHGSIGDSTSSKKSSTSKKNRK